MLRHSLLHHLHKIIKQIAAIVRAGGTFGMILHTESRLILHTNPLDRVIIEVHMRYFHIGVLPNRNWIHPKPMVLCSNLASAGNDIFHRMVKSAVTVVHFKCWDIISQCQQLVTQANAEYGQVFV